MYVTGNSWNSTDCEILWNTLLSNLFNKTTSRAENIKIPFYEIYRAEIWKYDVFRWDRKISKISSNLLHRRESRCQKPSSIIQDFTVHLISWISGNTCTYIPAFLKFIYTVIFLFSIDFSENPGKSCTSKLTMTEERGYSNKNKLCYGHLMGRTWGGISTILERLSRHNLNLSERIKKIRMQNLPKGFN